jgi:hypothetical protein
MPRLRSALQTAAWGVAQHSCPAFHQRRASSLELRSLASLLAVDEAAQQQLVCVPRNTHGRGMVHLVCSWRTHSGEFVAMHRGPIFAAPNDLSLLPNVRRYITFSLFDPTTTKPPEISPCYQDLVKDIKSANARYRMINVFGPRPSTPKSVYPAVT